MSSAILPGPAGVGDPPRRKATRTVLSVVVALLLAFSGLFVAAQSAHAGSYGVGYNIGDGWIGAYQADDGRQTYCIDLGANLPFSPTSGPQTVTSLESLSRQQLAELNYVMARWGQSGDPNVTSAVAMFVWSVADAGTYNSHGMSGDAYYIARAPSGARPTILALLAQMRSEAPVNAVTDPSLSLSIDLADQYAGTLTVAAHPSHLRGTALLSGAVFDNGATSRTLGAGQFGSPSSWPTSAAAPARRPSRPTTAAAASWAPGTRPPSAAQQSGGRPVSESGSPPESEQARRSRDRGDQRSATDRRAAAHRSDGEGTSTWSGRVVCWTG